MTRSSSGSGWGVMGARAAHELADRSGRIATRSAASTRKRPLARLFVSLCIPVLSAGDCPPDDPPDDLGDPSPFDQLSSNQKVNRLRELTGLILSTPEFQFQ